MTILAAAADVLRCFSSTRHDVSVTDLVNLLGMPKSNASRLLRTMRDEGFLEMVGDTKRYRPSLLISQVGQLYRYAASIVDHADNAVSKVTQLVGHTGYVSVRRGQDVIGVTAHPGTHALRVFTTIGDRIPAFASSTGRVLLARLSDLEVQELYKDGFVPPSATSPQNIPDLLARLADTRRQGYAESIDEAVRGVRAISVAVGDPRTGDEAALCISFPDAIVSSEERQVIIRHLRDGAEQIAALVKDTKFIPVAK
ncbi:IclR family transcriptional regulator [Brucella oryzae]|uniref:IclR family transcriptional regulator n=1 Tax=Brucella oryzae TaxID=335286 RepID=A0A2S7IVY5_9HYPH|nr:IclR family transcriptional regulator [Brucella oryzae]PQA72172.1 IclR family transcriptional regulator [Brucella oryzae]